MSVEWATLVAGPQTIVQTIAGLGILSAVIVYFLKQSGDKKQRRLEKEGLLRMLLVEVEENERMFEGFRARPIAITNLPSGYLRWKIWEDTRVRLAQLLKEEQSLEDIARCYNMVQQIEAFRLTDRVEEKDIVQEVNDRLPDAIDRCQTATEHIRKYVPDAVGAYLPPPS